MSSGGPSPNTESTSLWGDGSDSFCSAEGVGPCCASVLPQSEFACSGGPTVDGESETSEWVDAMETDSRQLSRRAFIGTMSGALFGIRALGQEARNLPRSDGTQLRFGVIADAQYVDAETRGSRFYRNSLRKLKACVDDLNTQGLDFVIHLGDFIDRDFQSFDAILPIYEKLRAPGYHVLGNHDYAVASDKKAAVPAKLGLQNAYYDFSIKGVRIVVLNGNDIGMIANPKGSPNYGKAQEFVRDLKARKAKNAVTWNGALGGEQLTWLRDTLADASRGKEKALIFCHFPVFPKDVHDLWNDDLVLSILESHDCVAAYLNGHNHHGNYGVRKGIHYVTLQGMVETESTTAYATLARTGPTWELKGHGREPDRRLT